MRNLHLTAICAAVLVGCGGGTETSTTAAMSQAEAQASADAQRDAFNAQEAAKMQAMPRIYNEAEGPPPMDAAAADKKQAMPRVYNEGDPR